MTDSRAWAPTILTPAEVDVPASADGLAEYLAAVDVGAVLTEAKAVLLRGWALTEERLDPVLDLLLPDRLAYVHGNSPRTKVGRNVYTSTEYPREQTISMHNELSYAHTWPSRLVFFCALPAREGGATPVLDGALWLSELDPEVRQAFAGGVRYLQNLHGGLGFGKSWQDTFETADRSEVDAFLAGTAAEWEWRGDGGLRLSQVRPATIRHPVTGTEVWFNQADQWHPAALGDEIGKLLVESMPAEELPQLVTFSDGSPIPPEYVLQIRDRGLAAAVDVRWEQGDLLVLDNVSVAHGRRPFSGERRVLVAMG